MCRAPDACAWNRTKACFFRVVCLSAEQTCLNGARSLVGQQLGFVGEEAEHCVGCSLACCDGMCLPMCTRKLAVHTLGATCDSGDGVGRRVDRCSRVRFALGYVLALFAAP